MVFITNTTVESPFFWNGYNERTLRIRLSYCSKRMAAASQANLMPNTTVGSPFFWNGYNERTLRIRLLHCSIKDSSGKSILFYLNFSLHYKIIPKYAIINQTNSSK